MEYFEEMFEDNSPKVVVRHINDVQGFEGNIKEVAEDLVIASLEPYVSAEEALKNASESVKDQLIIKTGGFLQWEQIDLHTLSEETDKYPSLIVSTKRYSEGTVALFYPGVLKTFGKCWAEKFICISISTDEWILQTIESFNPEFWRNQIQMMKESPFERVLSDHAYMYDSCTNTFSVYEDAGL